MANTEQIDGEVVTMSDARYAAWTVEMEALMGDAVSPFLPILPAPFWLGAWDLLQLKKDDVVASINASTTLSDDDKVVAVTNLTERTRYLRDDPNVALLASFMGYPPEQMDSLWLYVQEHYA